MITNHELAAMIKLAETNEGMRDLLEQVKTYWLLAKPTLVRPGQGIAEPKWKAFVKRMNHAN